MTGRTAVPVLLSPGEVIHHGRHAEYLAAKERSQGDLNKPALEERPQGPPLHLRICILAPRVDVGGGSRVLFEHANRLAQRGHDVVVLAHFPAPDWFPLNCSYRHVPVGIDLTDALPPCDVIVCGYWEQIRAAREAKIAPVVHFEQGDFHLFEQLTAERHAEVLRHVQAADFTTTVSAKVAGVLSERYQVTDCRVVHNAIDPGTFYPATTRSPENPYVLCVGWDGNEFKGISDVRQAWELLKTNRPDLDLVWVTPRPPLNGPIGRVVVAPSQATLADLYRNAAVYLCASHYESFPLPPLEAMASGTPVVTTDNVGVLEYAVDGQNALVVPVGDITAIASAVGRAIDDKDTAEALRSAGLRTAASFSWDVIITELEHFYGQVASLQVRGNGGLRWRDALPQGATATPESSARLELAKTKVDEAEIWVPVTRPFLTGLDIVTWEVAARRVNGGKGRVRVYAPHRVDRPDRSLPYNEGLADMAEGRSRTALDMFVKAHEAGRPKPKAFAGAVAKWAGLALAQLGRLDEAMNVLQQGLAAYPDNPDYVYLVSIVAARLGQPVDWGAVATNLALVGEGTRYLDWFAQPGALLEDRGLANLLLTPRDRGKAKGVLDLSREAAQELPPPTPLGPPLAFGPAPTARRKGGAEKPAASRKTRRGRHTPGAHREVLLSACMIVKDEQKALPDCLKSLAGVVDEVVVYDTGSTDSTVELARRTGARVIEGYWDDDFARARNASLEQCRGRWVLWIDADERLSAQSPPGLRAALNACTEADALAIEIYNLGDDLDDKNINIHRALRLFRRDTCCWYGSIHEQVDLRPDLHKALQVRPVNGAHIDHIGYRSEVVSERNKLERNLRLAYAALERNEAHPGQEGVAQMNVGRALAALGRFEEAQPHFDASIVDVSGGITLRAALLFSAQNLVQIGEFEKAAEHARRLRDVSGRKGLALYLEGMALRRLGQSSQAVELFEQVQDMGSEDGFVFPMSMLRAELSGALLETGRAADAADQLVLLLESSPEVPVIRTALKVFAVAGKSLEDLVRAIPESRLDKVAAALVLVPPVVADPAAEVLFGRFGPKPELLAAAIKFAPLVGTERALEWSARLRAIGMAEPCPLVAQAKIGFLEVPARVRAAVTAHAAFGDTRGAALAQALAPGLHEDQIRAVINEVALLDPALLTEFALAACAPGHPDAGPVGTPQSRREVVAAALADRGDYALSAQIRNEGPPSEPGSCAGAQLAGTTADR